MAKGGSIISSQRLPPPPTSTPLGNRNRGEMSSMISLPPLLTPMTAAATNAIRLQFVVDRIFTHLKQGLQSPDFFKLCFSLARGIDFSLSNNDVPPIASHIPSLVKQVYQQHINNSELQPAITVLIISAKYASRNGWFDAADTDELHRIANELCGSFCMSTKITKEASAVMDTLSKIIPRFCPHLKLGYLIASFGAKPGYDVLMSDFQIQKYISQEKKIALFVVRIDDLETSSCLITPQQVSFLVNGKSVARRTNVNMDSGPQPPTDITKMLKYGTNIMQAVGYFSGNYIIALAFIRKVTSSGPMLEDYVQPAVATTTPDSEIILGPSKISLNCPMSLRRISTPVKGRLCKHHQCFDYDNFMEMNSRKPAWRCPCCNQPTSYIDLRIDRNMVKILHDVRVDVTEVVISADGSWKVAAGNNGNVDLLHEGTLSEQHDDKIGDEPNGISNSLGNIVDITMDEDEDEDKGGENNTYEIEDRKPLKDFHCLHASESSSEGLFARHATVMTREVANRMVDDIWSRTRSSTLASNGPSVTGTTLNAHRVGTLESLVPTCVLNPVITDAISPASTMQNETHVRQVAENMQLQTCYENSLISSETERVPIPRQVSRVPIAIQALPVQAQSSSSSQKTHSDVLDYSLNLPSGSTSASYAAIPLRALPDGTISKDVEMQQTASGVVSPLQLHSMTQNWDQGRQCSRSSSLQQIGVQSQLDHHIAQHQMPNLRHQNMSQCTNAPEPACIPSLQVQQEQQDVLAAGNLVNHHNQILAAQRAAQIARLHSAVHSFTSRARSSNPVNSENLRLMGSEQLQNVVGGPFAVSRAEGLSELPLENNWRPTGRMRGSLTGSAYSSAINHYMAQQQSQQASRPSNPSVSTSDQLPVITNNIHAHGSLGQQPNWR